MGVPLAPDGALTPALELRGITVTFGALHALDQVDFRLRPGSVHALLGENGAGKSTLMHCAYGLQRPAQGTLAVHGRPVPFGDPRRARQAGLGMVHQHFTAIPALTVAENIALAAGWPVAPRTLRARTRALTGRLGLPLDPDARAGDLSVALRQRLEIVKALATDTTVLLLDEPTALLAPSEVDELLQTLRAFVQHAGHSAVLITHRLTEARRVADHATVLHRGRVALDAPLTGVTDGELAAAMVRGGAGTDAQAAGDEKTDGPAAAPVARATAPADLSPAAPSPVVPPHVLRASHLTLPRLDGRGLAVQDASFALQAGELVGVAAIEGNGQRELLRAAAGLLRPAGGELAVPQPVAFVPEDRTTEALAPTLTLAENVTLGLGPRAPWAQGWRVDWTAARRRTAELLARFDVRAPGPDAEARHLSGGNQQKLVIARALERGPAILVAENPTRGLDFRASAAVHAHLRAAAERGAIVLVHSTDIDEVLALARRLLVVVHGRVRELPVDTPRDAVGRAMLGLDG